MSDEIKEKKGLAKADVVFGVGVVLLLGGVGYFASTLLDESTTPPTTKRQHLPTKAQKHTAPFAKYVEQQPPMQQVKKVVKNIAFSPTPPAEVNKEKILHVSKSAKQVQTPLYACIVEDNYLDMVGKEIVYYLRKGSHEKATYTPAYARKDWDEKGIVLQKKFMATTVDNKAHMAEVSLGQWIPALQFASCVVVKESL